MKKLHTLIWSRDVTPSGNGNDTNAQPHHHLVSLDKQIVRGKLGRTDLWAGYIHPQDSDVTLPVKQGRVAPSDSFDNIYIARSKKSLAQRSMRAQSEILTNDVRNAIM